MLCPVCSQRVSRDAAACSRCGTNFRSGKWHLVEERRHFPGPGRIGWLAAGVLVLAAVISFIVALIANPPPKGDSGMLSGPWLLSVLSHLASIGLPVFVGLSCAGLIGVLLYAKGRGLQ